MKMGSINNKNDEIDIDSIYKNFKLESDNEMDEFPAGSRCEDYRDGTEYDDVVEYNPDEIYAPGLGHELDEKPLGGPPGSL